MLNKSLKVLFYFQHTSRKKIECCIRVVTKEALPEFTKWARDLADAIREELRPEEDAYLGEEIASEEPNRNFKYVLATKNPN